MTGLRQSGARPYDNARRHRKNDQAWHPPCSLPGAPVFIFSPRAAAAAEATFPVMAELRHGKPIDVSGWLDKEGRGEARFPRYLRLCDTVLSNAHDDVRFFLLCIR